MDNGYRYARPGLSHLPIAAPHLPRQDPWPEGAPSRLPLRAAPTRQTAPVPSSSLRHSTAP